MATIICDENLLPLLPVFHLKRCLSQGTCIILLVSCKLDELCAWDDPISHNTIITHQWSVLFPFLPDWFKLFGICNIYSCIFDIDCMILFLSNASENKDSQMWSYATHLYFQFDLLKEICFFFKSQHFIFY